MDLRYVIRRRRPTTSGTIPAAIIAKVPDMNAVVITARNRRTCETVMVPASPVKGPTLIMTFRDLRIRWDQEPRQRMGMYK